MIVLLKISFVICLHFLGDWIMQDRVIAKTKKGNPSALISHVLVDIFPYLIVVAITIGWEASVMNKLLFIFVNGITHFLIDGMLPTGKDERGLINWTALDCMLHLVILVLSLKFLLPF